MDGIVLGDTIDSFRQKRFVTAERRAKGSELAAVSAVLLTTLPPRVARWGQACRRVTEGRRNRSSAAFRSGGTESSNPASSSGESGANLTSSCSTPVTGGINDGNDEVGGDRFDESLRNLVREKHAHQHRLEDVRSLEHQTAGVRLIHRCELAKIALSSEDSANVFVGNFLAVEGPAANLNVAVSQDELQRATEHLIVRGIDAIHRLLEKAGIDRTAVEMCVPTGGMVNMPAIRNGLGQIFPGRVARFENSDRIISEGAAWIAADGARPILAKPIEVLDASQSPFSIVAAGLEMPSAGGIQPFASRSFYCADPRDGLAVLTFQRPKRAGRVTDTAPRTTYDRMYLKVDPSARPLVERLHLTGDINEDYVARFEGFSTGRNDRQSLEITDLEFALRTPIGAALETDQAENTSEGPSERKRRNRRRPLVRSNIAAFPSDLHLVAGDIIRAYLPNYLDVRLQNARNQRQFDEDAYYLLCTGQASGLRCGKRAFEINYYGCELCGVLPLVPPEITDEKLREAIQEEIRAARLEE
jgi:molecular chaperone DnaK